jgi:hypothetical protein
MLLEILKKKLLRIKIFGSLIQDCVCLLVLQSKMTTIPSEYEKISFKKLHYEKKV